MNAVKSWVVLSLFGDRLVVLRAFDVLERTGLGLFVYFWLVRLFRFYSPYVTAILLLRSLSRARIAAMLRELAG